MNTKITTIALLLGASLCAWGNHVTPERALSIANEFVANGSHRAPSTATNTFTLSHTAINTVDQATDFYVFNREGGNGFVIVAGDDAGTPVLAYSDHGNMDMDNLPCNVQYWLEQYQQQELQLRQHPELARQQLHLANSVAPLMTTKWNQTKPYNNLCPTHSGKSTYTGCSATALAQIMKYHNWPERGIGSDSYNWEGGGTQLSCDFSQSTYQWDKMLDGYGWIQGEDGEWTECEYTDEQATAVATLMRDVGYALHMNYGAVGVAGSGASATMVAKAIFNHFDYDGSVQLLYRNFYDSDSWDNLLRNELNYERPILYSGKSEDSGHFFVFDGYDNSGYFHINWGWGGHEDGYFLSSASGDYIYNQNAVIGIQPNTGSGKIAPLVGYCFEFNPMQNYLQVNLGKNGCITLTYGVTTLKNWETLHLGLIILNESENNVVKYYMTNYTNRLDLTDWEWWSFSEKRFGFEVPSNLDDGRYHLKWAFSTDNKATFTPFLCPVGHPGYILMEVKDGVAYFSLEEYRRGDVDKSGAIDGNDLNILINIILGKDNADNYDGRADLDGSTTVDGNDLNQLISLLLGK